MTPISLQLDAERLRVEWPDAVHSIPATTLRTNCHCAECQCLERTGARPTVAPGVTLCDATPVGHYGIQLHFSDSHRRGIYPWAQLRALAEQTKAPEDRQASWTAKAIADARVGDAAVPSVKGEPGGRPASN